MYLKRDLKKFDLSSLGTFDVILIDPPWEEYLKRAEYFQVEKKSEKLEGWTLQDIYNLKIEKIMANPSFVFLWVGSEHLDDGRALFTRWGLRRCDDIVWIKSNRTGHRMNYSHQDNTSFMKKTKEHCLVGLKDWSENKNYPNFIHPNIDTDVILSEQPDWSNFDKPNEIYEIIERFCLGRKRLHLFGNTRSIREGWMVIGKDLNHNNFDKEEYEKYFKGEINLKGPVGGRYLGTTNDIEKLRPKSPPKNQKTN